MCGTMKKTNRYVVQPLHGEIPVGMEVIGTCKSNILIWRRDSVSLLPLSLYRPLEHLVKLPAAVHCLTNVCTSTTALRNYVSSICMGRPMPQLEVEFAMTMIYQLLTTQKPLCPSTSPTTKNYNLRLWELRNRRAPVLNQGTWMIKPTYEKHF